MNGNLFKIILGMLMLTSVTFPLAVQAGQEIVIQNALEVSQYFPLDSCVRKTHKIEGADGRTMVQEIVSSQPDDISKGFSTTLGIVHFVGGAPVDAAFIDSMLVPIAKGMIDASAEKYNVKPVIKDTKKVVWIDDSLPTDYYLADSGLVAPNGQPIAYVIYIRRIELSAVFLMITASLDQIQSTEYQKVVPSTKIVHDFQDKAKVAAQRCGAIQ